MKAKKFRTVVNRACGRPGVLCLTKKQLTFSQHSDPPKSKLYHISCIATHGILGVQIRYRFVTVHTDQQQIIDIPTNKDERIAYLQAWWDKIEEEVRSKEEIDHK